MSACASLTDVPAGACGNGVVEAPEDCDTFSDSAFVCRAPGTPGECHFDCRMGSAGARLPCPGGWGCDRDGICRAPTGDFDGPAEFANVGAWSLLAGDFDGDGRTDVLSRDSVDPIGAGKLRFHYFDEEGALVDTRAFPKSVVSPKVIDVSGDGRSDLVFTDNRLGVLLGRVDRTWVPETFSSYRVIGTSVRMVSIHDAPIQQSGGFLALTALDGVPGFFIPDYSNGFLRRLGDISGSLDDLVGDPVSGDLFEDPATSPCLEVVYALRSATAFSVLESCTRDAATSAIAWRSSPGESIVTLDPPGAIDGAPQIADMNGDGHMDVLLGVAGKPYVSFGDGQRLTVATPYQLPVAGVPSGVMDIPMPLAAGDVTGDGAVDFVFPTGLLLSRAVPGSSQRAYSMLRARMSPYTIAKIADFNGNGKLDVAAASNTTLDIDFFNGTGTEQPTFFSLSTNGPVQMMATGDFDGDSTIDLAYLEKATSEKDRDAVKMAFGMPARPPLPAVSVASVTGVGQLGVYTESQTGNLMVVSSETANGVMDTALTLLAGSGDRIPFAPYELTTFASDGSLDSSFALALAPGAFTGPTKSDVVALAGDAQYDNHLQFWLLPALDSPARRQIRFDAVLDARFKPIESTASGVHVHLASATADIDNDRRDEAIFAMPVDDGALCGVVIMDVASGTTAEFRSTLVLDQTCANPEMMPVDADGDGWLDLALLTGTAGQADRSLIVLWNDGQGGFSTEMSTVVGDPNQPLRAFTALPATPQRPFAFAYVNDQAAMIVLASTATRSFDVARTVAPIDKASGIVAADVNGDGALDLVLAASGNLSVLKARLKSQ
jgi:hypothetical protein